MRIRFLRLFRLVAKQSITPGHRRQPARCAVLGLVFFVLSGCSGSDTPSGLGGTDSGAAGGSATGGSATGGAAGGATGSGGTPGGAGGSAGKSGMGGSASGTVDLCRGLRTGTDPIPYSKLAQPAVGVATKDPDFGTTIVRVTDITAQLGAGTNTATPVYPPVATWNIDESSMLFYVRGGSCGGGYALYDGHRYASPSKPSYAFLKCVPSWDSSSLTGFGPNGATSNPEEFRWDPSDPDILWWIDDGQRLLRYHVSTNANDVAFAQAAQIATHGYFAWDGSLFGMGQTNGFSLSLSGGTWTKSAKTISVAGDAPVACPSGGCLMSDTGLYDPGMNLLRTITAAGEHGDLGLDSSGNDYWATVQFGSPEPFSAQLVVEWVKTGQTKVIISTYPQSNTLISAKALKLRGWVAVNTTGSPSSNTSYLPTTTMFDQEIFVANVETGAFCRLAHHRALGKELNDKLGYFAQPQATFSPSGTRVVWNSDWGVGSGNVPSLQETYVVELPGFVPSP